MDTEPHDCSIDFLKLVDDNHLLKQLALSIASVTYLPAQTVFLIGLGVFASIACRLWSVKNQQGKTVGAINQTTPKSHEILGFVALSSCHDMMLFEPIV